MIPYRLYTLLSGMVLLASNIMLGLGVYGRSNVGGQDNSFSNPTIVPAGYAFSIWLPIYLGLFGYSIYQLWSHAEEERKHKAAPHIAINMLANAAWLPLAVNDIIGGTVILIGIMLYTLFRINQIWDFRRKFKRWQDLFMIKYTFTIYYAWVTVATALNVTVWLKSEIGWDGSPLNETFWSVLVLLVAFAIAAYTFVKMGTRSYGFVIIWAFSAIYVSTISVAPMLAYLAAGLSLAMVGLLADRTLRKKQSLGFISRQNVS